MGFNSGFKGLNTIQNTSFITCIEKNSYLMQNNDKNKKKKKKNNNNNNRNECSALN